MRSFGFSCFFWGFWLELHFPKRNDIHLNGRSCKRSDICLNVIIARTCYFFNGRGFRVIERDFETNQNEKRKKNFRLAVIFEESLSLSFLFVLFRKERERERQKEREREIDIYS